MRVYRGCSPLASSIATASTSLTTHLDDCAFIDDGGQWVSPNQGRILALASELDVQLFPSWGEGKMILVRNGERHVSDGLFLPQDRDAAPAEEQGGVRPRPGDHRCPSRPPD